MLLDLLLPAVCPGCSVAPGPGLCDGCRARLEEVIGPCPRCGTPRPDGGRCPGCRGRGLPLVAGITVRWSYAGLLAHLVGAAKATGDAAALHALRDLLPPPAGDGWEAVVPVPPSPGRRSGPHLATALARSAARRAGRPLRRLLVARRLAAEQHRLGLAQRERNVRGLFRCRGPVPARVLLVDDLLTSGATAGAAARTLRGGGAREVHLLCLARTPREGEPGSARERSRTDRSCDTHDTSTAG